MHDRCQNQPDPGERVKLGLRVTPELKSQLDVAAKQSGRSQSQEAEFRLEQSFDRHDLLRSALILAYGPEVAGLLMMSGVAMLNAGLRQYWTKSDFLEGDEQLAGWINDSAAYDQALRAINLIFEAYRPREKSSKPNNPPPVMVTIDEDSPQLAASLKVVRDLFAEITSKKLPSKKHIHVAWHDPHGEPVADAIGKLIDAHRLEEGARTIGLIKLPAKQQKAK